MLSVKILEIRDTPIKDISNNVFDGVIADQMQVRWRYGSQKCTFENCVWNENTLGLGGRPSDTLFTTDCY